MTTWGEQENTAKCLRQPLDKAALHISSPSFATKILINQLSLLESQSKRGFHSINERQEKAFIKGNILFASDQAPSFHMQVTLS